MLRLGHVLPPCLFRSCIAYLIAPYGKYPCCVHSITGQAIDRCLFSRADLIVARRLAYFGQPVFFFLHHVLINRNIQAAIKRFLKDRLDKGLTADTQTARDEAETQARLLYGNVWDLPLYAREVTIEGSQVSLEPYLKDALVVPPIMHIQVRGFMFFLVHVSMTVSVICHCWFVCLSYACVGCRIVWLLRIGSI